MANKMCDFITIPRSIFRDESLDDGKYSRREAFLYLVQKAVYQAQTATIKGGRVELKRGQLCASVRFLSDAWGWSKDKVSRTLADFVSERRIDIFKDTLTSIISIVNYDVYQPLSDTYKDTNQDTYKDSSKDTNKDTNQDADKDKYNKDKKDKKDNNQKKTSTDVKETLVLPFTSDAFVQTWGNLIREPKWKSKTANALQLSLNKLGKYDERFAVRLMEEAIEHGWQGVVFSDTDAKYAEWISVNPPMPKEKEEEPTLQFGNDSPWEPGVFYTLADFQATEEGRRLLESFKGGWEWDIINEEGGLLRFKTIWEPLSDHPEFIKQNKEKYNAEH